MKLGGAFHDSIREALERIVIFNLHADRLDISAAETLCRVNKTGIVESDIRENSIRISESAFRSAGTFLQLSSLKSYHESKVVIYTKNVTNLKASHGASPFIRRDA